VNLEQPPSTHYLGVVECPYLDSLVSANREGLVELDGTFARIRESALESVSAYAHEVGTVRRREFIERARAEEYYPYRAEPTDAVSDARRAIYDVVLDRVNEHANLEGMSKKQQAVVFRLLARALRNENLLEVLSEVARLSDEDIESFRRVLEKTTLESIVRLSSEVTERIHFLDVLNELVYGDVAKHVKERSQLHRILDSRCWVFGSQYHLASSDKSFRDVIQRHRAAAGLASVTDDQLAGVEGVRDIPDLFFVAERDYPVEPKHWRLLVELKAPKVNAGRKELEQVRRYAERVHKANDLATPSTRWDVFLVTTGVKDEIERDRCQKDRLHGCAYDWGDLRVWVVKWSEVIQQARDEMALVRDHLKKKSEEISVSDFLRENFPDILAELGTHPPVTTDTADTQTRLPSPRGNRAGAEKL
jgi:hypothetical protein